jgi:hypothetical protein
MIKKLKQKIKSHDLFGHYI